MPFDNLMNLEFNVSRLVNLVFGFWELLHRYNLIVCAGLSLPYNGYATSKTFTSLFLTFQESSFSDSQLDNGSHTFSVLVHSA